MSMFFVWRRASICGAATCDLSYGRWRRALRRARAASLNSARLSAGLLLTLGPLVLHAAYLFGGPVRAYNRLGDYSYGVYIYAFPIQQASSR